MPITSEPPTISAPSRRLRTIRNKNSRRGSNGLERCSYIGGRLQHGPAPENFNPEQIKPGPQRAIASERPSRLAEARSSPRAGSAPQPPAQNRGGEQGGNGRFRHHFDDAKGV